ncbi:hypothetical protein THASP1DRAFT_31877 [Thamnocephalis sphaerospora]|uniref:RGS domain-containing protein n=1 Tax=Thamnocephalis sphaerospora TaxID=78915 RepID=A0A4P9XKG9_9FUNG|nr:hypothetical protein THASP1DRAFT_31877 [Thamnocephalis sphaerospora]|eukprot:RKP06298.1 hypothetical protein THASP1DRAFT_31877 [Thamnocephalis sphaerospora]
METRTVVYLSLLSVYVFFAIASTILFYCHRNDTGIRHRGVQLTVISAIVNIPLTVILMVWTPMNTPIPGWVILWALSLLVPTWVLLSFSRFLRLVFLYRVSEAKLLAAERGHGGLGSYSMSGTRRSTGSRGDLVVPSGKETFESRTVQTNHSSLMMEPEEDATPEELLQRNWFHRNRKRVTARLYMQTVAIFMSLHVVATGVVSVVYATVVPGTLDVPIRERSYSLIPLEVLCMIWYGMLLFFLREQTKVRDAHGIHLECKVWLPISAALYSTFLITSWAVPEGNAGADPSLLPPALYAAVHFMCGHCVFVVWPAVRAARHHWRRARLHRQPSRYDQERRSFDVLLGDPRRFAKFKAFCVIDFSVENALFLERYRRFKDLVNIGNQTGTNFSATSGAGRIIEKSVAFLVGSSIAAPTTPTTPTYTGPGNPLDEPRDTHSFADTTYQSQMRLSDEALKELKAIYATFMAPDAEFEVNLTSNCRQAVADRIRDGDAAADTLDEAHREIHQLVYQSTYPRYLNYKNEKRVSSKSAGSVAGSTVRNSQVVGI